MTQNILRFAAEKLANGQAVALVTVTATHGSSPASPGQVMAVLASGASFGTVGGGASEHALTTRAAQAIQAGETSFAFSFDHGEQGMVCGGGMEGYGIVWGAGHRLVLFGGGHVAQSIAPLAQATGFAVAVVEDRPELAAQFPEARFIVANPAEYAQKVPLTKNDYVVICTRGHRTDDDALRYCLAHATPYLGMIGSQKKVATLFDTLRREGVADDALRRVYAPVGLDVASNAPAEIAISVLAEILLVKNGGSPRHKRDV